MPDQFDLLARRGDLARVMEASVRSRDIEKRLERTAVREMAVDPRWEPIMQQIRTLRERYARESDAMAQGIIQTFLSQEMYGEMMVKLGYARGVLSGLDAIMGYVVACTREEA